MNAKLYLLRKVGQGALTLKKSEEKCAATAWAVSFQRAGNVDLSQFKTAPPPAANDAKISQAAGLHRSARAPRGSCRRAAGPAAAGQEARASEFLRAGFENRYPAVPPGEKSNFPKPQSTRCVYVRQLPAELGNARPRCPQGAPLLTPCAGLHMRHRDPGKCGSIVRAVCLG